MSGNPVQVNGNTLTFTLQIHSTVQLTTLTFDFDQSFGQKPTQSITWTYSGAASGNLSTTTISRENWQAASSVSLSGIRTFTAGQTINVIGTINDGNTQTSQTGDIGFDNFTITAVPEPINLALAACGLCVVGFGIGRRVHVWARA